jgi:hypothetical protein
MRDARRAVRLNVAIVPLWLIADQLVGTQKAAETALVPSELLGTTVIADAAMVVPLAKAALPEPA